LALAAARFRGGFDAGFAGPGATVFGAAGGFASLAAGL
jgi:hypothetical protein